MLQSSRRRYRVKHFRCAQSFSSLPKLTQCNWKTQNGSYYGAKSHVRNHLFSREQGKCYPQMLLGDQSNTMLRLYALQFNSYVQVHPVLRSQNTIFPNTLCKHRDQVILRFRSLYWFNNEVIHIVSVNEAYQPNLCLVNIARRFLVVCIVGYHV